MPGEHPTSTRAPGLARLGSHVQATLSEIADAVLAVDAEGRIFYANEQAHAMSGYQAEELLDCTIEDLVPEDRRQAHVRDRSQYHQAGARPRPMGSGLDIVLLRKDGSRVPADVALSPVQTLQGDTVVIAAIRAREDDRPALSTASADQLLWDLHENAIQTLFGLGLTLQVVTAQIADQALADRITLCVDLVNHLSGELRDYHSGLRTGILARHGCGPVPG